jgi:HK97 family phage major capsid protein/HK97 family phage prohead protease
MSWDGSPSRYTDEQYRRACVLDRGPDSGENVKERYGLPVRDPDGTLNCAGVAAARQRIGQVTGASGEQLAAARHKLDALASQCSESRARPMAGEVEERAAPGALIVEGRTLVGLIPYGRRSADLGGWTEVMQPGCLRNADLSALVARVDHGGLPIGRYPGTLALEDRDDGLHWSVELPESRADVREAVSRGDLKASSWRMTVARDRWDGDTRYVEEVRSLRDVSVVTDPAYGSATAELRSAPESEPKPQPEEATVPDEPKGGLTVESRSTDASRNDPTPSGTVEERVLDAIRAVPKGEARSLTEAATATPLTPPEISNLLWDRLRDAAVVLASGVPIISTSSRTIQWPRLISDVAADFYDELEEIAESDPGFDEFTVSPSAIKALVRASAEAVEDSDPDLLQVVQRNLETILALKLDRELLVGNSAKGFLGMVNAAGVATIDAAGAMADYDLLLRAVGVLGGRHVPGPYVAVAHPWTATHLSRIKTYTSTQSNETLPRPDGAPDMYLTSQVGHDDAAATAPIVVYAPKSIACVRRRDVTVEVDRSQEFSSDAVLVRGKLRATLFLPHVEAVCVIENAPAPDPEAA